MLRLFSSLFTAILLTSCTTFPTGTTPHGALSQKRFAEGENARAQPVWLICGALHSDFVVRTQWLLESGCDLPHSLRSYRYLCFGWGDREAYTNRWGTEDIPSALFWPSESIVHVVAFNGPVRETFPQHEVVKSLVPSQQGPQLAAFINGSFSYETKRSKTPITLRPAKWGHGYFVKSPHSYYFPRMCNQWVASALNAAGIKTARPSVTMSSQTLKGDLKRYNEGQ